jgi:dTDP-glucose pyrophosphorylase
MKALILAGGRGNRINEFSENQNKCMIPFRGKPLIEFMLEQTAAIDFSEIVIVVGYKAEDIINQYGISYGNKRIRYVIQAQQKGLVHAIECARNTINGEDFFLMLGDEVMSKPKRKDMVNFFQKDESIFGVCGILKVNDLDQIRRTYAVVKDDRQRIFRLIEKPRRPINEFQGTGHCIFRNRILDYIDITPIHYERGEKELPDLIQCCIDDGKTVKAFHICEEYTNINCKEDLLKAEGYY